MSFTLFITLTRSAARKLDAARLVFSNLLDRGLTDRFEVAIGDAMELSRLEKQLLRDLVELGFEGEVLFDELVEVVESAREVVRKSNFRSLRTGWAVFSALVQRVLEDAMELCLDRPVA